MPIDNRISKKQVLAPGIAAALMMVMAPVLLPAAFAAPTIHGGECGPSGDNLVCDFDISGLGGAETATGTLTGTATVTTGCVNRGGNEPSGLEEDTFPVLEETTVNVEGGRADFHFSTDFSAEDRDCPSANMTPVIVCATFTELVLTVDPSSGPTRAFPQPDETTC
jgi:hypothetical protein